MHKIFAKPLFLGKKVVFLPECHSTNDELAALAKKERIPEGTVVYTDYQSKGKGQRGNVWFSEPGKNLLLSFLLKPTYVRIAKQHLLNIAVGLGVLKSVSKFINGSTPKLKWPNDVFVGDRKMGGILIENTVKASTLDHSIIGLGLNLNQQAFSDPKATSLFIETGNEVDRESFIQDLLVDIEHYLFKLRSGRESELLSSYYAGMFKKGELASYRDQEGEFEGVIIGVTDSGRLLIDKGGKEHTYGIKEIEFLGD